MSAIGRIFIVLNLILAAGFVGWAGKALGSTEDFKEKYEAERDAHQATIAEKDAEISSLNVEANTLRDDQRRFQSERDDLKSERDRLQAELAEEKRRNGQMQAQLAEINATLGDYNDSITQLGRDKDAATEARHEAENERDDAVAQAQAAELARRDAEEASDVAAQRVADLEAERDLLREQLRKKEEALDRAVREAGLDLAGLEAIPQIDGAVVEFRSDLTPGLVMLNVGRDDGVKRGHEFHIYRGAQYKGQVKVEGVENSYCSAIVIATTPGRTIQQGDRATTIL